MNLDVWLSDPSAQFLSDKAAQAWEAAWTKFFLPKVNLGVCPLNLNLGVCPLNLSLRRGDGCGRVVEMKGGAV